MDSVLRRESGGNKGGRGNGDASAPRILVVEDEQIVAADIRQRLNALGYAVPAVFASGEEAIARIEEIHPDLMLLDIVLRGDIDGVETARTIRARHDIPIIFLTAYTDDRTVQRAKETEPLGYLLKPFDERELRFAIEVALHKHQAEQRLREREQRFHQLVDNPGEVLWMMDAITSELLYVSPAYQDIWGRTLEARPAGFELWINPVHPDDRMRVIEQLDLARRGDTDDVGQEYRITRPDGSVRWILTRVFPVRDVSGTVYRITGTSRDVTREKWAWESLRESEERYRLMAENATDLIARHSPEGICLYASPASRLLLGYRPEELLGSSAYGFLHPEDLDRIRRVDADAGHFLASGTVSYRIRKKDGTYIWFETTARTVRHPSTGEVREVITVSRDISERKWAEEILRRYEFIANASQEFMTLIDRNYVYEAANDAYCRAHAKPRADIVGHTVAEVWGEETFSSVIKAYLDQCFTGVPVHYERWFEFGGRVPRFYRVNYYPYVGSEGRVTHCVVVSHDITVRKSTEDQLQTSLREKEVLLKEVHHRVKNNLQVISSLLSLQSSSIESSETRELVRESQNRVRSMALIHEKLYQSDSLARIDFGEYLRNLTRDLFRSYSAGGVALKLQAEDVPLDVDAAVPCGLIVNELVSNALKYAFPAGRGGELSVSFARVALDRYALTVTDNGVGLPKDLDVRNARTLGLQLVTMLVTQLHGTLDVVSDGGTTFLITLPAGKAIAHQSSRPL
jgi:PAS domain S-box-containing protein